MAENWVPYLEARKCFCSFPLMRSSSPLLKRDRRISFPSEKRFSNIETFRRDWIQKPWVFE